MTSAKVIQLHEIRALRNAAVRERRMTNLYFSFIERPLTWLFLVPFGCGLFWYGAIKFVTFMGEK
jgi:hypothetical protein